MSETATVDVVQGTLQGHKTTSITGKPYYSFLGVPFAKPPVGPLRFKDPEPPEPWSGVHDATDESKFCTQFNMMEKKFDGREDCLYLNVFTPQRPDSSSGGPPLPVVVLIHGGGFVCGSGLTLQHGPDFLVEQGLVIVSPNYRVGVLGFLSVEGPSCPGNMGLKDQVAALRWTQQNIAKFGGDPNNVTIMGVSAGGASVHFLLLSPLAKGLFHKAVSSSGSVLNPWAITPEPRTMAFNLGKALGCSTDDPDELMDFLRTVDHIELVKACTKDVLPDREKHRLLPFVFTPTLEVEVQGVERFLPGPPLQLLQEGRFHAVPVITGVASEECLMLVPFLDLLKPGTLENIEPIFEKAILPELRLPKDYKYPEQAVSKLRHFFLKDKPVSMENLPGFLTLMSDVVFAEGINTTVKLLAKHDKAPVYQSCYSQEKNLKWKMFERPDLPGGSHGEDLIYTVLSEFMENDVPPGSPQAITRARMLKIVSDFARTGNPTPEVSDVVPIIWEPHTSSNPRYLDINEQLTMKTDIFPERMAFWEQFYKAESP